MKNIKATPQNAFYKKSVVFWKLCNVSKNVGTVLRVPYLQTISYFKNENQTPRLGIESII